MVGVPLSLEILLLLASILAGVLEYRRSVARGTRLTLDRVVRQVPSLYIGVLLLLLGLLAIQIVNASSSLAWHLPLWWMYYDTVLLWGMFLALCAFVFSLAATVAFDTHSRERWKIAIVGALVLVAIHGVQWYYTRPVAPYLRHETTGDGVILQSSGESCAAATGANIAGAFGLQKTEREMAGLFGTTKFFGTSPAQVVYGMRTLGLAAHRVQLPSADPAQLTSLAMLFVDHPATGPESHAVAFMGLTNGTAEIWDPLVGKRLLNKDQLARIWHGRGVVFSHRATS